MAHKTAHILTFDGEVELAGVLASVGRDPALPEPCVFSGQERYLKLSCTLI